MKRKRSLLSRSVLIVGALAVVLAGWLVAVTLNEPRVSKDGGLTYVIQNDTDQYLQIYDYINESGEHKWSTHAGPWSPGNVGETGSQYCAVPPLRIRVMEIVEYDERTAFAVEGDVFAEGQWPSASPCGGYRLVIHPDHRLELFECVILGRPCDKPVPGG